MTEQDPVFPQPDNSDPEAWLTILEKVYLDGKAPQSWPDIQLQSTSWSKFVDDLLTIYQFIQKMTDGDLSTELPVDGNLAGSLKTLQARLTEQQRTLMTEREQREQAEALRETAAALNSAKGPDEVFDNLLRNISRAVPHDTIDLLTVDSNGNARVKCSEGFQHFIPEDLDLHTEWILPVKQTPNLREMSETGLPCRIDNLLNYPWVETGTTKWARSQLAAPILVRGKVVGFLTLLSATPGFFSDDHMLRVRAFADLAAIAIEKASLTEQLNDLATLDSLTGIANRRYFFNLAEAEITRAIRYHRPLSALMMDIDHFTQVNDRFGHNVGDKVLQAVAQRCSAMLRTNDLFGRYGGEEFVFVLPETDIDGAWRVADRLQHVISGKPFTVENTAVKVTVSFGVTNFNRAISSARALIDQAGQALYQAKLGGRNRIAKVE